jgi:hypothetical protein
MTKATLDRYHAGMQRVLAHSIPEEWLRSITAEEIGR